MVSPEDGQSVEPETTPDVDSDLPTSPVFSSAEDGDPNESFDIAGQTEKTPSGRNRSSEQNHLDPEQIIPFLQREFTFPAIDTYIEARFEQVGVLPILEQAGILPPLTDLNPYHPEEEAASYEQWWAEHPTEQEVYNEQFHMRQQLLKYLHIGALVGILAGRPLYPGRTFPGK
jgi:hypothetical protein